jgi:hypothetical protein
MILDVCDAFTNSQLGNRENDKNLEDLERGTEYYALNGCA